MNRGDELYNEISGQRLVCLRAGADTDGELLELESRWERGGAPLPEHVHPSQSEHFELLEGTLIARVNGAERTLAAGDALELPAGTPHTMWNPGPAPARAIWQTRPALNTERFLQAVWGLAASGRVDADGSPRLRDGLSLARSYQREFRVTRPPWPIQRLAFLLVR
jgi:mannose-6-phosphate isomerase-like protein (cupin superfamily)